MAGAVQRALKQKAPFVAPEVEIVLGLRIASARIVEPWAKFLRETKELTPQQYNVLRILRGAHPAAVPSGEIAERMIDRDPDVTRLVDRLERRGLVDRIRSPRDRRVIDVAISAKGLAMVRDLDPHVRRMPTALLGALGAAKLERLRDLIDDVLEHLGTFP